MGTNVHQQLTATSNRNSNVNPQSSRNSQHQTSINVLMQREPDMEEPNERTKLLSSGSQSRNSSGMFGALPKVTKQDSRIGFWGQVRLLLWKCFLQQSRSIKVTVAEIFIPLLGAFIMLLIRQLVNVTDVTVPTIWPALDLDAYAARKNVDGGVRILFAPNTTLVNSFMTEINATLANHKLRAGVLGFPSEADLLSYYHFDSKRASKFPFSVVFSDVEEAKLWPQDVTYKLRPRTNKADKWNTQRVFPFLEELSPRNDDDYYYNRSFLYIQRLIGETLIKQWSNRTEWMFSSWNMQRMPYPPYIDDVMTQVLQMNFPVLLMLSFILSVIILCKNIVYEKERQLKESMKLMGLSAAAHWTSWFLLFFIYLLLACAVYTLFMSISVGGKKAVLVYSDPSIVFVFLLLYSLAIISYCFFISTLVNKANVAAAVSGIVFFAIFFPYYFLEERYEDMSLQEKLSACILFNLAMSYGMKTIGLYEGTGKGAQWSSFTEPASVDDNFSLLHAMIMLIIDAVIFLILTWYIDNVKPGEFGVPRPWYFPFQSSYWCGGNTIPLLSEETSEVRNRYFEREPVGLPVGIKMMHLRRIFGKNKVAVKDSTLNMYEGQITVLLGHNGAGKTTTMSMLTGFIPPTSGTAFVNGFDIRTDINKVRKNLGLCPQHNILFDSLTVEEHLTFFANLKGCQKSEVAWEVASMVKEVGLEKKCSSRAGTLSGGQKRKLSVGIALIGGSKIVILDEPTSGMDPAARRQTWDILQRNREGRTLLLSTHFMDEADLLGDRIAIMAEGVVKCCGTSMFLKKLYGAGYHLVMVKGPGCDVPALTAAIQREIPSAWLESEIAAEITYLLPEDQVSKFPHLFRMIESQTDKLGITNFGIMATTMEEVFLKVGASGFSEESGETVVKETSGSKNHNTSQNAIKADDAVVGGIHDHAMANGALADPLIDLKHATEGYVNSTFQPSPFDENNSATNYMTPSNILAFTLGFKRLESYSLEWSKFYGMFFKKAIHTFRNRILSCIQLALPVIFTIAALLVDKVRPKDSNDPPLTIDLSMFDGTISYLTTGLHSSTSTTALGSNYTTLFGGDNVIRAINRHAFPDVTTFFVTEAETMGLYTYNKKVMIGAQLEAQAGEHVTLTSWFSGQPYHAMPVSLAYILNALAHQVDEHTITTINHPMPKDDVDAASDAMLKALQLGFSIGFSMLFGMAFLTSSFSYFLIKERLTGAKHLQVVSGVGPLSFWLASLAWDFINFVIPCLVLLIVFAAFQVDAYLEENNLGLVLSLLLIFGLAVLPFVYLLQYPFQTPATGFVVLIILSIVSGLFTMLTVVIMRIPSLNLTNVADSLDWVFMAIFPHYSAGMAFSNIYINKLGREFCLNIIDLCPLVKELNETNPCCKGYCGSSCVPFEEDYMAWDYPGVGRNLFFMLLQGCFYFFLTLAIEYHLLQKLVYFLRGRDDKDTAQIEPIATSRGDEEEAVIGGIQTHVEDSDVYVERRRVMQGNALGDVLVLKNLNRNYGNFVAVRNISVGIPGQECFGLLGQNGAGKTSTFKMLTGDVMVSSGDAFVLQRSIKTDIKKVQSNMGYCPQFDALIDQMTGRETLIMYARLRGVPSQNISAVVGNLLDVLMLTPHADKLTQQYSGGNKRKLSTAIALVGNPAVVLLDEPSSGMDPAARRQLWTVLSQVRASGKTLILTSHSMEECDALCTRIAIMVNGEFKCLGSPQHLKSKFGQGYTLIVKMALLQDGTVASSHPIVKFVYETFPGSQKFDDHQGYIHFQVPQARIPLSEVFATMECTKSEFHVEDYSVHQTTLEQIFLTFTRAQFPPQEFAPHSLIKRICPCC